MKKGYLSEYFEGVAAKILTMVEVDDKKSNQHEFQGISSLRTIFGNAPEPQKFETRFLFFTESSEEPVSDDGFVTWSNVRRNNPDRSPEFHLYYSTNLVQKYAHAGDILLIAKKKKEDACLAIITRPSTTISSQLSWLFGVKPEEEEKAVAREISKTEKNSIRLFSSQILETIGISVETTGESFLDGILEIFSGKFPGTREFSEYARTTLSGIDPTRDYDQVLMAWLEREELLFRTLEEYLIKDRLKSDFKSVDDFISFSLSVQNRRKSRAGYSLENHLEALFQYNNIMYSRNPLTENRAKPDFIFPNIRHYDAPDSNPLYLTMLGVKTTCKDRWRQILVEADRIKKKHLLTLEAAISENQTSEMKAQEVRLVLPSAIHETYSAEQQKWLLSVSEFTDLVMENQKNISKY